MSDEDLLATDIASVGSCSGDIRDDDESLESLVYEKIYLRTHVGNCLQTVLNEMLLENEIGVRQKCDLELELNRIYHSAFSHCQRKLHLNIRGKLNEYATVESGSYFRVEDCAVNGPSSTVRVPEGQAHLVYALRP